MKSSIEQGLLLLGMLALSSQALAVATPEELAGIGTKYTCTGAEKAGTATGGATYTGRYLGAAPGMQENAETGAHPTDPYDQDQPILTITRENMASHAERLTAGQRACSPNTRRSG